jgi:hypothetical protein
VDALGQNDSILPSPPLPSSPFLPYFARIMDDPSAAASSSTAPAPSARPALDPAKKEALKLYRQVRRASQAAADGDRPLLDAGSRTFEHGSSAGGPP